MEDLLRQIDAAAGSRVYYLALIGALTVPDVAGALAHPSGEATPERYKRWVRENLPAWSDPDGPNQLYQYRNSVLHQHRSKPDPRKQIPRLLFQEPSDAVQSRMHNFSIEAADGKKVAVIDVRDFCAEMTSAARSWLQENLTNATVLANQLHAVRRYPQGFPPFVVGAPVIT